MLPSTSYKKGGDEGGAGAGQECVIDAGCWEHLSAGLGRDQDQGQESQQGSHDESILGDDSGDEDEGEEEGGGGEEEGDEDRWC